MESSCGGNFVTAKRNRLGSKKVEELILIKENKKQIEEFKEEFKDQLQDQDLDLAREQFRKLSVIAIEDDEEDMFEVDVLEPRQGRNYFRQ